MTTFSEQYAQMYDNFHELRDIQEESKRLIEKINEYIGHDKITVGLDLGCGTGKQAEQLIRMGLNIYVSDTSTFMLDIASKRLGAEKIFSEGIRDELVFDFIYSMFDVVSYQSTIERFEEFLVPVNRHLHKGGIFIFDGWYLPGYLLDPPRRSVRSFFFNNKEFLREVNPLKIGKDGVTELDITLIDFELSTLVHRETHILRAYTRNEVRKALANKGFEICEFKNGDEWSEEITSNSWRFFCIARKL